MVNWFSKPQSYETDIGKDRQQVNIRDIATETFPANNGRISVWNLNQIPDDPNSPQLPTGIEGIKEGDIITWRMGHYLDVVKIGDKLCLRKRPDQFPPK